jgi:hypothetical protein
MATVVGSQLLVAQMGAPRTDRAFNRAHETWRTLAERYVTTRHPQDLAALPLHEGRAPRLYALEMLTPSDYAAMQARRGAERVYFLVRVAVKSIRHPDGTETRAAVVKEGDITLAPAEWVATLQQHGGLLLAEELAMVIERRAVIGDLEPGETEGAVSDPLDRYALPPGVTPGP